MIKVVDMIMSAGKSSAAISYMNEHPDKKYLYVTPFIDETERIAKACAELHFLTPSDDLFEYHHRKRDHLRALANQGRNVAMTHTLFSMIDDVTARVIADHGYVIIIDEAIDIFRSFKYSEDDIGVLLTSKYLKKSEEDGEYVYYNPDGAKEYTSGHFKEFFEHAKLGQIVCTSGWDDESKTRFGFWMLNKQLFRLSDEIYILTYLFDGMPLKGYLEINKIPYEFTFVRKCEDGKYRFSDAPETPGYVKHLRQHIHLCEKPSINAIGDRPNALSATWTKAAIHDGSIANLRKHINAFFRRHVPADIDADKRLWCTFKDAEPAVRDKGFTNTHLVYNSRATNDYNDRAALAYCVNIYPQPGLKEYLAYHKVDLDWDKYAIATMVQWIWRSRIRNGQDIWLYIPSRRMRTLFIKWMKQAEEAYDEEVKSRNAGQ